MKDHAISQDWPRRPALLVSDANETPRTCLPIAEPDRDGAEDDGSWIDAGEPVVAGSESSPLLVVVERALDDGAAFVCQ